MIMFKLIRVIPESIILVLRSAFDINILNVNLWLLFCSLFSLLVLIVIIRRFL